ncbi:MAG: CaiB/BaiF CoA transferase family protein [Flavobacteriales bacterium]
MKHFNHLTVLEFAGVLAGPSVGMFFSELGAKVIKIENRNRGGDMTRSWKLPIESNEDISAYFCAVNYNKEYIDLDLTNEEDRRIAYNLIKSSDIVLSNFKAGDDKKLGLTNEIIKNLNPSCIIGKINGFSSDENRVAFDVVLQAETGYIAMTGTNEQSLAKLPVAFIDLFAAHQLKEGILIALIEKLQTGRGAIIEVSLEDAAIASLANQASNFLMRNHIPKPIGTEHPNIAPYGDLFYDRNKTPLLFAIGTDKQFGSLCSVLGLDELAKTEAYKTNAGRIKNRNSLILEIQNAVSNFDRESLIKELTRLKIPCASVLAMNEVFEKESAQNLILEEIIENQHTKRVKTTVFKISQL